LQVIGARTDLLSSQGGEMRKGRILKVRSGHEANCSSGMVALTILMGAAVTLLPSSLIVAGIQAGGLGRDRTPPNRQLYWILPVGLGILLTGLTAWWSTGLGYNDRYLVLFVLGVGGSFILACVIGYVSAPRMNHPGWLVLIAPLIVVVGSVASLIATGWALAAIALSTVVVVIAGQGG
jgi:hypothetical protein